MGYLSLCFAFEISQFGFPWKQDSLYIHNLDTFNALYIIKSLIPRQWITYFELQVVGKLSSLALMGKWMKEFDVKSLPKEAGHD